MNKDIRHCTLVFIAFVYTIVHTKISRLRVTRGRYTLDDTIHISPFLLIRHTKVPRVPRPLKVFICRTVEYL